VLVSLLFDSLQCFWGKEVIAATYLNDTTINCVSIDISKLTPVEQDRCVPLTIIGYRNSQQYLLDVPFRFLFGTPRVLSLTPSSVDIDQASTIVTINGEFFNGVNPQQTNFSCRLGTNPPVAGQLIQKNGNFFLTCSNLFNKTTTTVGSYPLEIQFACSSNQKFTTNRVLLRVTQNPQILNISPAAGADLGGVQITVRGSQFNGGTNYFCSFGNIRTGTNTLVSAKFESASQLICLSPYMPVSQNTAVELAVSLDGGQTFVGAPDDYIVQEIVDYDEDVCPLIFSGSVVSSVPSMLFVILLIALALLF